MFIYKITNIINGKIYIGKTNNPKQRFYKHKYLAQKGVKRHLYNAMRKYGVENFIQEIIEECDDSIVNDREKFWIKQYNSTDKNIGYNKSFGGEGGDTWTLNDHKKETSEKLSMKLKGHSVNYEAIKREADKRRGTHLTDEQKHKLSQTLIKKYQNGELTVSQKFIDNRHDRTGEHHTDDARRKISEFRKGKTLEELYGEEKAKIILDKYRQRMLGKNNPLYVDINIENIVDMIKQGYTNLEVADYFGVSPPTIWKKLKDNGYSATQIRKEEKKNENLF